MTISLNSMFQKFLERHHSQRGDQTSTTIWPRPMMNTPLKGRILWTSLSCQSTQQNSVSIFQKLFHSGKLKVILYSFWSGVATNCILKTSGYPSWTVFRKCLPWQDTSILQRSTSLMRHVSCKNYSLTRFCYTKISINLLPPSTPSQGISLTFTYLICKRKKSMT